MQAFRGELGHLGSQRSLSPLPPVLVIAFPLASPAPGQTTLQTATPGPRTLAAPLGEPGRIFDPWEQSPK